MSTRLSRKLSIVTALVLVVMLVVAVVPAPAVAQDDIPWPTNGWQTSTPEEQGVDSGELVSFLNGMARGTGFHSLLVIRHGYLVLDAYEYPFRPDQPHALYSATKSVVSTLVGIAIDKGYIRGVDQSIWDFFPQELTANMDTRKEAITVEDLLTQRSRLGFPLNNDIEMYTLTAEDQAWVQYVLDRPMTAEPGTEFNYLDANVQLLSAIITRATGMSALEYAQDVLFGPLNMGPVVWVPDPQGISRGGDNLYMSPYDMAKLGYLYLHEGAWNGAQIVSSSWIDAATRSHVELEEGISLGYGYLWWNGLRMIADKYRAYSALGFGGQEVWVVPELDLVIVTTQDLNWLAPLQLYGLANSIKSDMPLPATTAADQLRSAVAALSDPVPVMPRLTPDTIGQISGQMYVLEDNFLGWKSISLEFQEQEAVLTLDSGEVTLLLPIGLDGIRRVSTHGFPADPVWWPIADVPLALKGYWSSNLSLTVYMSDLRGMLDFEILMSFYRQSVSISVKYRTPYWVAVLPTQEIRINGRTQ